MTVPNRELVTSAAQAGVQAVAPEELALFDVTSAAYFAERRRTKRDTILDFGAEEAAVVVSSVALVSASHTARSLLEHLGKSVGEGLGKATQSRFKRLASWIRKRFSRTTEKQPDRENGSSEITGEKFIELRDVARSHALTLGMDEDRASLMADAIVGNLVTQISRL